MSRKVPMGKLNRKIGFGSIRYHSHPTVIQSQNSAQTNDDAKEIKGWEKKTLARLTSLYLDEETSDVDVRVGELIIPAHKVILKLNSQLLTVGEIGHNSGTKKMEVELLPEFAELFDVVSEIVESFYTGKILLTDKNAKAVYKFAKSYDVPLLLKKTYPYLVKMITEEGFPSMLDFSQNVNCSKLMKCCLRKFDNSLSKVLRESEEFLELDYYRIKLLTSSSHIKVDEGKLFKVICKWLDHKPMERGAFAKTLLSNFRYDLIGHWNLVSSVYVWIGESQSIDDEARIFLLKAVIAGCKSNDDGWAQSDEANRPSSASSSETSSD
ncbi:uncharacterized protein LOC134819108 [Bolinopsis microptera]|uniref:uncharacterized protein LOC134819108 n=1 Tax=Bolinopsis microptera TaxID=2820187 RepID=UPI003078B8D9